VRADRAQQRRTAIIVAAERLLLKHGFAATTIADVAKAAEVSVETIYKTFGGKAGLVRAICTRALAGRGPIPAEVRSDEMAHSEQDPKEIIRQWGVLSTEVAPRISPILLLLRDAAISDPDAALLQTELDAQRLARMTHNAQALTGHLRAGLTIKEAGVILWTYSSPELYELLVIRQRWDVQQYATFITGAISAALLPPAAPARGRASHRRRSSNA
jgi:AcrR family transcriptional regulator